MLEKLQAKADLFVVSATPNDALEARMGRTRPVEVRWRRFAGRETGTKKETLVNAKKYSANHTLMIGDAPGDFQAAQANNALFFPINPGHEEASWSGCSTKGSSDSSMARSPAIIRTAC